MTFLLPEGITGFSDSAHETSLFKQFKSICFQFVRTHYGTVTFISGDSVTPNYHLATITVSGTVYYVMLCRTYPVIGISTTEPFSYTFVDLPELTRLFPTEYLIPSAQELSERFNVASQPNLNQSELGEIKFWRPNTVGDVIFHYWD